MAIKKPWVIVHAPLSVGDIIFKDARMAHTFKHLVENKELPNLLIHGPQGTGKSSLSNALLRDLDIDELDQLRINCSDEKIDAMRDKVRGFALTMPISDLGLKVVQLEEIDYLSQDAQALLRSLIEDSIGTCRFIATCNYINKVIPPLRSRFQEFVFNAPDREDVAIRAAEILTSRGVAFSIEDLDKVMAAGYPDIRKIIHLLEQHSASGELKLAEINTASDWKIGLLGLLETGDLKGARKLVCESATKEELVDVFRFLYDNLYRSKKLGDKWDEATILIAQYQYQHGFVADPELQVAALFCELGAL